MRWDCGQRGTYRHLRVVEGSDQYFKQGHERCFYASNASGPVPEKSRKSICTGFLVGTARAAVHNLFNLGRHLVRAEHYRSLRVSAFEEWGRAVV